MQVTDTVKTRTSPFKIPDSLIALRHLQEPNPHTKKWELEHAIHSFGLSPRRTYVDLAVAELSLREPALQTNLTPVQPKKLRSIAYRGGGEAAEEGVTKTGRRFPLQPFLFDVSASISSASLSYPSCRPCGGESVYDSLLSQTETDALRMELFHLHDRMSRLAYLDRVTDRSSYPLIFDETRGAIEAILDRFEGRLTAQEVFDLLEKVISP